MTHPVRSAFEIRTTLPPTSVLQAVHERLSKYPTRMSGIVCEGRIELYVPSSRQRLLSPQLTVDVAPLGKGGRGSLLRARLGAHPHVWALLVIASGVTAMLGLAASIFGYAQWVAGDAPWALWGLALAGFMTLLLRAVAWQGRRWNVAQVDELRRFLQERVCATERDPSSVRPDGVFSRDRG